MLKNLIRRDKQFILNLASVIGVGLTMVSTIKDTTKAYKLINDDMALLEKIKKTWKCYIPSGIIAISTILCIIYSDKVTMNEKIALLNTLTTIQSKYKVLKKNIYANCDDETREKIIKDSIRDKIPKDIYLERTEEKYFYEEYLGDFFITTMDNVLKAEYLLNKQLYITGSASLNDFYKYLGLEQTDDGKFIGWTIDEYTQMSKQNMLVNFIHEKIEDDSGLEFYHISYSNDPDIVYSMF
jgi:hypothetical protein